MLVADVDFFQWDIDFYPRGVRYGKAQIINVYNNYNTNFASSLEIPEVLLRTVRLSVTCKSSFEVDQRFMVSLVISLRLCRPLHTRVQIRQNILVSLFFGLGMHPDYRRPK